ncbi:aldehyde dehydrogenase [Candidatus Njordibacter sp. Uisw_039]|jgi:gamma-glutamyl-gamma-aminobutyraldehyde dehydrogenase|uniref:aldehyde dehydrogenase n=1 Tax=Candidatus Njordibacter sp. Uisw_039 TaxID=3230972 RepID=UPI003A3F0A58|tara:strand:- start:12696 stop:14222 length:1527 start_codon:yes stop_codon:yes gene_type:complete
MLTQTEYLAIAAQIDFPSNAWINGSYTPAISGETFSTLNPATGQEIGQISACDRADVDVAVDKARQAFEAGVWSKKHPSERKKVMIKFIKLIKRNEQELAVMEALESGKPIKDCVAIDVPETIDCIQWHAEAIDKIYDQISPSGDTSLGLIQREPIGVVACVLPWNFPMLMAAWKLGPALAAGNSVILKPAEQTSMTCLRLAQLAHEAGVPAGVINVLPGLGETCGKSLGLHQDIDAVSFTGSTEVGRLFLQYSAQSNLKRVVLECGGKNPCIVLDDAERLDEVAEHVVNAVFWNMGENCSSNSRLIVHSAIKQQLMGKVLEKTRDWITGDPMDPRNALGAMISQEHFSKVMAYIKGAQEQGAELILGGSAIKLEGELAQGLFIEPTIFDQVTPNMTIALEEVFGPVLAVMTVNSAAEAVALANDTCYGLHASLFTSNGRRAHNVARAIKAGTVSVNCYSEGDMSTPFGGYKQSGFGGRDNSLLAHDQYTETKTIWLDLSTESEAELD